LECVRRNLVGRLVVEFFVIRLSDFTGAVRPGIVRHQFFPEQIMTLPFFNAHSRIRSPSMFEIIAVFAVILAVAIAIVLVLAATKPDTFRVQRTTAIKAPAEKIFPLIGDFHQWRSWSPWENRDPEMKRTYDGAPSGKGAVYAWDGNGNVGSGRMEILDSAVPSKIVIKLDFIKPFEGHNTAEFTMVSQGDATHLTWLMQGRTPFLGKIMHVFINMDRMIGKDFEAGLANLKKLTEN
jgi:uncharacterized protein YndB with AHSA1/START domain